MPVYALDDDSLMFPPAHLAEPEGLLAVGGDLSLARLLAAYRLGIFPWYSQGDPILWWSPAPRCVILPQALHIPRSLAKIIRAGRFTFTVNAAFDKVIRSCAGVYRPGQPGTWIMPEMIAAYTRLHQAGAAHSVEAWQDGELAGGLYGVAVGRGFYGESMFHRRPDASKAAFTWLARNLFGRGFRFIDCQQETKHMLRFGAKMLARAEFEALRAEAVTPPDEVEFFRLQSAGVWLYEHIVIH